MAENLCYVMEKPLDKDGYIFFHKNNYNGKFANFRFSRIILEEKLERPICNGYYAHHTCGVKNCANPAHIVENDWATILSSRKNKNNQTNNFIIVDSKMIFQIDYLLKRGKDAIDIVNLLSTSLYDGTSGNLMQLDGIPIPLDLVCQIKKHNFWDLIHITRKQKVEALFELAIITNENECIFLDPDKPEKVAFFSWNDKLYAAPRYSRELLLLEKIADNRVVRHECDMPGCINPKHLTACTQKENVDDMRNKKRGLSDEFLDENIHNILKLHDINCLSFREIGRILAKKNGREKPYDHKIITRRYYKYYEATKQPPPPKKSTQYEILMQHKDEIAELYLKKKYNIEKIRKVLGYKLRGKPFNYIPLKKVIDFIISQSS